MLYMWLFFEKQQSFNISLIKDSRFKGCIELSLDNIVESPGSCFKTLMNEYTNIIITAKRLTNSDSYVEIYFIVNNISGINFNKISNRI